MRTITLIRKVISRLASALFILAIAAALFLQVHPIQRAFAVVLIANDDDFGLIPINGFAGGSTSTVYSNDDLDGGPVLSTNVTPTIFDDGGLAGVTIDASGALIIPAGTAANIYTVTYQICEVALPASCDTADVTVLVVPPVIDAVNDDFSGSPIDGLAGGSTATVFSNDTLNGAALAISDVTPTIINNGGLAGLTINADGTLTIPADTPANTYTVTYRICEVLNSPNCNTATTTVVVVQTGINAVNDDFSASPVNGAAGGTTATVFSNDTIDGVSFANSAVTPSIIADGGLAGVVINTNGTLTIPAPTANNTYTVTYQICRVAPPNDCDTANVTVVVAQLVINAVNDDFSANPVNGVSGGTTATAFGNDTLNGAPFLSSAVNASISDDGGVTGVVINATNGTLSIPTGTAANTYIITYEICEAANPTNCDTATATVIVFTINAVNNNFSSTPIDGAVGGLTATVFTNDTLDGDPFLNSEVNASITNTGGLAGVTINTSGRLNIPAGTADSTYTVTYQICEAANPTNCDTANVTVRVGVDPTITKSRSRSSAAPGDTIVFTMVVRNPRTTSLTNVVVTDSLDDRVDFVSSTTTRGTRSYSSSAHEVTFNIGTLTAGQSATLTITVRVESNITRPSTITNVATVDSTQTNARDSNTVSVSIPAASSSATATPAPTSTPSSGTPGQLPETGEQPSSDIGMLWAGLLAFLGICLVLLMGLGVLLVLPSYHKKAAIIDAYHRIGRRVGLGLLLILLACVVVVALKQKADQAMAVSSAQSSLATTDQQSIGQALFGLIPAQETDPLTETPPDAEAQSPATPIPPATHLIVPVLNLDTTLVEARIVDGKWDVSQLATGVAHLERTAYPGTRGNVVLAGHVLTKRGLGPFYKLKEMGPGDTIIVEGSGVSYIYQVEWVKVVAPSDIEVASAVDASVMTLLTCTGWNSQTLKYDSRLAVRARLIDTVREELGEMGIQ